ncbi:hypothetical protein EHQ12_05230, partial [Leptospira gomenensis]
MEQRQEKGKLNCPRCANQLDNLKTEYGYFWICQSCFGHFISEKNIIKFYSEPIWTQIKATSKSKKNKRLISCPSCKSQMKNIILPDAQNEVEIDLCDSCEIIWFDKNEIEDLRLKDYVNQKAKDMKGEVFNLTTRKNANISEEAKIQYLLANVKLDHYHKNLKRKNIILDALTKRNHYYLD